MNQEVKLTLSKHQLKKLVSNNGQNLRLQLKKNQLIDGIHSLLVNKRLANKIEKHKKLGKGVELNLTSALLKKNQKGGFLPAIAAVLAPVVAKVAVDSGLKAANADSAGKRKIRARLEYLRGNGSEATHGGTEGAPPIGKSKTFMDGYDCACKHGNGLIPMIWPRVSPPDLLNLAPNERVQLEKFVRSFMGSMVKGKKGSGVLGEFIDGFTYGISSPFEALEFLGREADYALSKPKKKKGASRGKGASHLASRGIEDSDGQEGGGIQFY